jgi:16S rRNA (cytidine1402-2'-O)-methyltransferase
MKGTLYLVATPIGNLADISLRAIETLKTVDLIACEDTRHSRKLLTHYQISNKLISYHEHNEETRAEELAKLLLEGKNIAVISDAGTPAICDPSFRIVQKANEIGAKVVSIPGAVAFVNALIISGLPTDSFYFGGFLPSKKGERIAKLNEVKDFPTTLVFYETPHRINKCLLDCLEVLGNRKAAIVRELTKIHEEVINGDLQELVEKDLQLKGEIVLIIDKIEGQRSKVEGNKSIEERFAELEKEFDRKIALKKAAKEFGLSKSEAYRILQAKNRNEER